MSYRRALLTRWDRRDRLGVAAVGLTVALLTGVVVVVTAATAQTLEIAAAYGTVGAATPAGGAADAALLVSHVAGPDGPGVLAAQPGPIPPELAPRFPDRAATVTRGTRRERTVARLAGPAGAATVAVDPRAGTSLFPPHWYLGNESLVAALGRSGAYSVAAADGARVPGRGVPLRGALAFFRQGTAQVRALLWLLAAGATVLVGVTTFSVTRMAVRDRRETVRIARATGATPAQVLATVALRGALLAAVGVALGYAIGIIAAYGAVTLAVFTGGPAALAVTVTSAAAWLLAGAYALVVLGAAASAALAAWPWCRRAPAALDRSRAPGRARSRLAPQLLGWRALVPTAGALTVFVVLVLVLAAGAGALGALQAGPATITEPGAAHPVASTVPEAYADALAATGRPASGELLLFGVRDGEPYLARGAEFERFAAVSNATLVSGRAPDGPTEAVVGTGLAATLDVDVGETLLLGGSTEAALAHVHVVGRFDGPGPAADQLVLPLPTARHLAGRPPGTVQFVRTAGAPVAAADGPAVVGLDAPGTAVAGRPFDVTLTALNPTSEAATVTATLTVGNRTQRVAVDVGPDAQATRRIPVTVTEVGELHIAAAGESRTVSVVSGNALRVVGLPTTVPPDSAPLVTVRTAGGDPVPNATVRTDAGAARTDDRGRVRVPFEDPGERTVTVTAGERATSATVTVSATASRTLVHELRVDPAEPTVLTAPTARLTVRNPWTERRRATYDLSAGGFAATATVAVPPGEARSREWTLPRRPAGDYDVVVTSGNRTVATERVTVRGDERLAGALAASGRRVAGSSIGRGITVVLGNLRVLVGVVAGLTAAATVASVAATFAQSVHARRRTVGIYRATGASPRALVGRLVADALAVGTVAVAAALLAGVGLAVALERAGLLTVFGLSVSVGLSPGLLVGLAAAGYALVLLGAGAGIVRALRAAPGDLLDGGRSR